MIKKRPTFLLLLALLFSAAAVALAPAPTIALSAPTSCSSQAGYTCNATVNVSWVIPIQCTTDGCHFEYCLTENPQQMNGLLVGCVGNWVHPIPLTYNLGTTNGPYTVYAEYRQIVDGIAYPSAPTSAAITLDASTPSITLNSPAGLPGAVTGGAQQILNNANSQWITGSVSTTVAGEPVSITAYACGNTCTQVANIPSPAAPPYTWTWPSPLTSGATYIKLTVTDAAGLQGSTTATSPVFSLFSPGSTASAVNCGPSTQTPAVQCTTLADQLPNDMPGDPPSSTQQSGGMTIAFSGYSDPSMRADPLVVPASNPNGTNLWMLYSYPKFNQNGATFSGAVETHLASSNTVGSPNGGATWSTWCTSPPCSSATPIWPSLYNSATNQWSSHEVANFWVANVNQTSSTDTWYAVHLMYFVTPGTSIPISIQNTGCLVTTVAQNSPTNLGTGWSNLVLNNCSSSLPSGNTALQFTQLTQWANAGSCSTWGEPAIMVSGTSAYLAASCLDQNFQSQGYYILTTTDLSLATGWGPYAGPFYLSNLPNASYYQNLGANSITEFDWAKRADGSLVALVSPTLVPTSQLQAPMQFGCVAVNFTLAQGSGNPFGTVIATLTDTDGTSDIYESQGPNGCTYDPTSNTGIIIVRHLLNTALAHPSQYQLYSLIDSGIMP